ncbi:Os1348 family NHLP clan protein [Bradyrhizobium sp. AUGA SZCCT0158]|uniref:Os1348 family NHLP clan protein n=1 Tax=Bradyrhizobium sp. AUGA SZCCT0158 TaxID=2807661 RepID=UPI00390C630A
MSSPPNDGSAARFIVPQSPPRCVPKETSHRKRLHLVLGRMVTDIDFRHDFRRDPDSILANIGIVLTPYELAAAMSIAEGFEEASKSPAVL